MRNSTGASVPDQAGRASHGAAISVASPPSGDHPSREELIHRVILAISSASVPHEHWQPGALSSRSLGYYLGVGIDHFQHDYARHEILLRKAAEQAIAAIAMETRRAETENTGSVAKP